MKIISTIILALLIPGCTTALPDHRIDTSKERELERAMAYGLIYDLNKYSPDVGKNLLLRMYEVPAREEHDCFIETSGVCRYEYTLSVSTFDEAPTFDTIRLNHVGKISEIEWKESDATDSAWLSLKVDDYTPEALKNNPNLKNTAKQIDIHVSVDGDLVTVRQPGKNEGSESTPNRKR